MMEVRQAGQGLVLEDFKEGFLNPLMWNVKCGGCTEEVYMLQPKVNSGGRAGWLIK